MRGYEWAIVGVSLLPACAEEGHQLDSNNVLELRLGGEHESLSQALRRPPPDATHIGPPRARPAAVNPAGVIPRSEPPTPNSDPTTHEPATRPPIEPVEDDPPIRRQPRPDTPKARPSYRVVVLAEGQTLYSLCRIHLGSGTRWKEVAALNGWSESRAGRLPAGQSVKLPARN